MPTPAPAVPPEDLLQVLRHARRLFGVSSAAIVALDGDRAQVMAMVGAFPERVLEALPHHVAAARAAEIQVRADAGGPAGPAFYAGCPIALPDGRVAGTFCVLDERPTELVAGGAEALADLAGLAGQLLAARAAATELSQRREASATLRAEHGFIAEGEPRRALLVNAGIPIVVTLVLGLLLGWQAAQIRTESHWLSQALEVRRLASRASVAAERMESSQRGYLLTGDPAFAAPYERLRASLPADLEALEGRVADLPEQVALVRRVRANFAKWEAVAANEVRARDRGDAGFRRLFAASGGAKLMEAMRDDLEHFVAAQMREVERRQGILGRSSALAAIAGGLMLLLSMAFFALSSLRQYRITRGYYRRNVGLLEAQKEELAMQADSLQAQQDELTAVHDRLRAHAAEVEAEVERRTAALAESEERYRDLFENATDLVAVADADGRLRYVNRAWAETLGYADAALADMRLPDLAPPSARAEVAGLVARVLAGEPVDRIETVFLARDGREVRVDGRLGRRERPGEPPTLRAIFRDVTERYAAERMKDEFLSIVSHELRTPLTSIRGSLSLLASGKLDATPEKGKRMLEIAAASSERLVRLINDILDIDRLGSGKAPLERRPSDLAELASQAADAMRGMAEKAGVALDVAATPIMAEIDPDRLTQVLANLISNAVKFSEPGGRVRVSVERAGDDVRLGVRDEGRGIPEAMREAVFERFHQVDSSDARQKGGTGLGLAICKAIVEQHGGRIWVEPVDGPGADIRFTLPLRGGEAPPAVPAGLPPDAAALVAGLERAITVGPRPTRALVVEDDAELAQVLVAIFQRHGVDALAAADGEQARALADHLEPDLLVLDVVLPAGDGYAVIEGLRADPRFRDLPLVVYSAREVADPDRQRLTLGPTEFLVKGMIAPEDFEARITGLLARLGRPAGKEGEAGA